MHARSRSPDFLQAPIGPQGRIKWSSISIWHGTHDQTVRPENADRVAQQWSGVYLTDANLKVLDEHCRISDAGQVLCTQAEIRDLTTPETQLLTSDNYLGCRNPVGLDHILVGPGIKSDGPAEPCEHRKPWW